LRQTPQADPWDEAGPHHSGEWGRLLGWRDSILEEAYMRSEALSPHDVAIIIQALAKDGQWEGRRAGFHIRLVRFRTDGHQRIEYAYKAPGCRDWKSADALTVHEALQCCNRQIALAPVIKRAAVRELEGEHADTLFALVEAR